MKIIDRALDSGVAFDWIGGDGLYGHNSELRDGLQSRGLFYVLDVHKDEKVFTEQPVLEVPKKTHKRGRPTKKAKPNMFNICSVFRVPGTGPKSFALIMNLILFRMPNGCFG